MAPMCVKRHLIGSGALSLARTRYSRVFRFGPDLAKAQSLRTTHFESPEWSNSLIVDLLDIEVEAVSRDIVRHKGDAGIKRQCRALQHIKAALDDPVGDEQPLLCVPARGDAMDIALYDFFGPPRRRRCCPPRPGPEIVKRAVGGWMAFWKYPF